MSWLGRLLLVAVLVSGAVACGGDEPEPSPDLSSLNGAWGAYAITSAHQLDGARRIGLNTLVAPWDDGTRADFTGGDLTGFRVVDSWVQKRLYATYCPTGSMSCAPGSADSLQELRSEVRRHVLGNRGQPVVGYYVLDDDFTDFSAGLKVASEAIRRADPRAVTVCGIYLPLRYRTPTGEDVPPDWSRFDRSLRNYSPSWCDSVLIYAYGPSSTDDVPHAVDWTMPDLADALDRLRARGWRLREGSLLGTPQAFGYRPRIQADGRQTFRQPPTQTELTTQIEAFCRAGASGIIAYAWDDEVPGTRVQLANSSDLRQGMVAGAKACERVR